MPDKPISGLPEITDINDTDLLTAVRPGDAAGTKNKKISGLNSKKAFTKKLYANLDAQSFGITNLLDPINPQDAATRIFVESLIGSLACPPESQIYHVGSHGSDTNSGLCRAEAVATTNYGISLAFAQTPLANKRYTIFNPDAHEESSFVLSHEWINLDLRHTNFSAGSNKLYSNTSVIINDAETFGGTICVIKEGSGLAYFYANSLTGIGTGTNLMLDITGGGTLVADIRYFNPKIGDNSIRVIDNSIGYIFTDVLKNTVEVETGSTLYLSAKDATNVVFTGGGVLYLQASNTEGANFSGFTGTLYRFSLKGGGSIIDPILHYASHPTFPETDTEIPDIKEVKDLINAHPSTNLTGVKDVLPVTSDGQTAFTLSQTPIDDATLTLILNHTTHLRNGIDYTYTGTALTWLDPNGLTLKTTDELVAHYNYLLGAEAKTKSAFFSLMYPASSLYENYVGVYSSGGSIIRFTWTVPDDYQSTNSIKLLALAVLPNSPPPTPLLRFELYYGQTGEDRNTHSQAVVNYYPNWSTETNKFVEVVLSDLDSESGESGKLYNNIQAGDRCCLRVDENYMGNILYLGIQINYT